MHLNDKLTELKKLIYGQRVLVALSGGVDSSVLAKLALDTLGSEQVIAVTISSEIVAGDELAAAHLIADSIGIRHQVVEISSLADPKFKTNPVDRCYHCKHMIYSRLLEWAADNSLTMVVEGTNASDQDDYRPGLKALQELGIVSPFLYCGITKVEIRRMAQDYGFSHWNRPANACLASRIPYNTIITPEILKRVEACEKILQLNGFSHCRVRHHGDTARIEVPVNRLANLVNNPRRDLIINTIKEQGYKYVTLDLEGYRTGSLNEVI